MPIVFWIDATVVRMPFACHSANLRWGRMGLHSHGTVTKVFWIHFFLNSYSVVLSTAQRSLKSETLYSNFLCIIFSTTYTSVDHAFLPGALASLSLPNVFSFCGYFWVLALIYEWVPFFYSQLQLFSKVHSHQFTFSNTCSLEGLSHS